MRRGLVAERSARGVEGGELFGAGRGLIVAALRAAAALLVRPGDAADEALHACGPPHSPQKRALTPIGLPQCLHAGAENGEPHDSQNLPPRACTPQAGQLAILASPPASIASSACCTLRLAERLAAASLASGAQPSHMPIGSFQQCSGHTHLPHDVHFLKCAIASPTAFSYAASRSLPRSPRSMPSATRRLPRPPTTLNSENTSTAVFNKLALPDSYWLS